MLLFHLAKTCYYLSEGLFVEAEDSDMADFVSIVFFQHFCEEVSELAVAA